MLLTGGRRVGSRWLRVPLQRDSSGSRRRQQGWREGVATQAAGLLVSQGRGRGWLQEAAGQPRIPFASLDRQSTRQVAEEGEGARRLRPLDRTRAWVSHDGG